MIGKTKHIYLKMISVKLNVIYGNNIYFKTMYSIYTCLYIYVCECKETKPVHSEGDQPWDLFGRNDAKAETPVLWPPHAKS